MDAIAHAACASKRLSQDSGISQETPCRTRTTRPLCPLPPPSPPRSGKFFACTTRASVGPPSPSCLRARNPPACKYAQQKSAGKHTNGPRHGPTHQPCRHGSSKSSGKSTGGSRAGEYPRTVIHCSTRRSWYGYTTYMHIEITDV